MATTVSYYNVVSYALGIKKIDFLTDDIKMALLKDTYTYSAAHTSYTDVSSHEISQNLDYVTGGKTLTGVSWTSTTSLTKFSSGNVEWITSGITASVKYAVCYDNTTTEKYLIALWTFSPTYDLVESPFKLIIPSTGIFSIDKKV